MILDKESLGQMVENKFEVLNQARDIATKTMLELVFQSVLLVMMLNQMS